MADAKISDLLEKTDLLVDDDLLVVVDSEAVPQTTKHVKKSTALNSVYLSVKKSTAGTINPGEAVYIVGYDSGDDVSTVELADNSSSSSMPAFGIAKTVITNTDTGIVVLGGELTGLDTSSYSIGTSLYIGTAGQLTATKPDNGAQIQKIAVVSRADLTLGVINLFGAGRSNDLPNLSEDATWIGDSNGVPQEVDFDTRVATNSDIQANNTHRSSDGTDHSDVVLNNTHRSSDGTDHSDVVLNNAHRAATGNPHSADTDDIPEGAVNKYYSPAWLQYSNGTTQTTTGTLTLAFDTDQESLPDGIFTKVNTTDFRTDFLGSVEMSYSASIDSNSNNSACEMVIVKNGTPLEYTRRFGFARATAGQDCCISGTFSSSCAVNDVFTVQLVEPGGDTINIPANRGHFYIKALVR
jgi:hypothetical protein